MNDPLHTAADLLAERRLAGLSGPRLPVGCRPVDTDSALSIQRAVIDRLGGEIGGWKCGLPVNEQPVVAPLPASFCFHDIPVPVRGECARVEPELAFVFARDLPPQAAPRENGEVDAALAGIHLALELIGCRYHTPDAPSFPELLADSLGNEGLFVGPSVDMAQARLAAAFPVRLRCGSMPDRIFEGRHPAGQPQAPLYWLVEFLRRRGQPILAGQAVITGSFAGVLTLPVDEAVNIRFGDLGEMAVRFTSQPSVPRATSMKNCAP